MGVMEQCWVTMAIDDVSAARAVVLANSLRRVLTTRRIAVIFCNKDISPEMRKTLLSTFDQCMKMDMLHEMNGIPLELYVKIYCWSIPFMRKCVFLHSDTLVVKNCDELFDCPGVSAKLTPAGRLDTSVCLLEPSLEKYEKLVEWMKSCKHHEDANQCYGKWIQQHSNFSPLDGKFNVDINLGENNVVKNEISLSIVRFLKSHPMTLEKSNELKLSILGKAVVDYYRQVYDVEKGKHLDCLPFQTQPLAPLELLRNDQEPIAIVGMACRFPLADNTSDYWDILINGKDCIRKVPEERWPSATSQEFREVQAGFLKCPVDEFDGKFFNISPFELSHMDPQQRLLLEVTWESLEHAGINPQSLRGSNTGAFVGTWTQDYRDLIKDINEEYSDFHRTYMGNSLGGSGGRISFVLGLTGPNISTESGCSSGIVAVYLACESLRQRRSEIGLAAGANLLLHPFQKKHMVNVASPDGRCKTFDESADGFGRAEGVAALVLKRYSDALKSGDNVLALIRGYGISQEGVSKSFGTPTKAVQEIAMRSALADACVAPSDVSYVEAHGTGTVVGDPIEMAAITSVYCGHREKPLLVASGKTNIGHTESCSGLAGIIKVILAMKHEVIPPHINLNNLNPYIKIENVPVEIPTLPVKWERTAGKPLIAGVSSFGITGTDAHMIIQEAPKYNPPRLALDTKDRPLHLVTFSGKSDSALNDVLDTFANYLEEEEEGEEEASSEHINLADAAFTLNSGRGHFTHRVGILAKDIPDLKKKLKQGALKSCKILPDSRPKLCFLFTGQGSQYEGMAQTLYDTCPVFRLHFDKCDKVLQELFKISIKPVLWPSDSNMDNNLSQTLFSQTSIFCVEYCLMKVWQSWGIEPDAVVGHSLGEFAACVCAGILELEDAIRLVAERSRLIEGLPRAGKMVVIKGDHDTVDKLLSEFIQNNKSSWLDVAAVNSPEQTVLAGPPHSVDAFVGFCSERNLKSHILEATSAFHSRDMDDIIPEYEKVVKGINSGNSGPASPRRRPCTYISGVRGRRVCEEREIDSKYWIEHTRDHVRFMGASKAAYEMGCRLFVEIGPQPILCALTMSNVTGGEKYDEPVTLLPSLRKKEDEWVTLLGTLSKLYQLGFPVDWHGFDEYYPRKRLACLPTYPFNRKKHWYESKDTRDGVSISGKSLHPLLGCEIPNATTSTIFQSVVELEKVSYLKEHGIGGRVVFPGAAYLEMGLAAGNISTIGEPCVGEEEDLMNPISIESLTIEAPLGLVQEHPCHIQTIVVRTESADNKVSIYAQQQRRSDDCSVKWIRQASATFVPLQASAIHETDNFSELSEIKSRCGQEIDTAEFYEKLMTVGLAFGESFRSLRKLWRNNESSGGNEILCEVAVGPQCNNESKHYICHPVLLDALIQTIMIGVGKMKESLFVPVLIDKVIVFSKIDSSSSSSNTPLYAHCKWEGSQPPEERSCVLYTSAGKVVAVMKGVQMMETSTEVILKTLDNQQLALPDMFEEVWRPTMGPLKARANLASIPNDIFQGASLLSRTAPFNELSEKEERSLVRRDKLIFHYILRAFYQLGWDPKIERFITANEAVAQLGISKSYSMLVHRFFQIFIEEGILEEEEEQGSNKEMEHKRFKTIKLPPKGAHVDHVIEEIILDSRKEEEAVDFHVITECGERLKDILSGKISALSVLFPEDKNTDVSAEGYYNNFFMAEKFNWLLQAIFSRILEEHSLLPENEQGVLRVLEVGAGTGSSTKHVLPLFQEFGCKVAYTYTDISPAFFAKAQGLFQSHGKNMHYKVLNIEEDPLAQGFIPNHYDIIFASNVIHATRDVGEALRNSRLLLKENGYFVLAETLQKIRDYDIIFGLLDGFWRFTDRDLRQWYPTVSAQVWREVCEKEGFDRVTEHLCFDGRLGVVTGKAAASGWREPSTTSLKAAGAGGISESNSKWWLLFSPGERLSSTFKDKLVRLGRNVMLISSSAGCCKVSEAHYEIRPECKEDMERVFQVIKEKELAVEGILFLWGLDDGDDDDDEKEQDHLRRTLGFLSLAQILLSDFKGLPRVIVASEGIIRILDESATNISSATLWGMAKTFRTEHFSIHVKSIDLDPDETDEHVKYEELFTELWNDDHEFQIAYREGARHVARLVTSKDFHSPLVLPRSERYSLLLPATKSIADLRYFPNGKSTLKGTDIEVRVKAFGLNFRDVFTVLKPTEQFEKMNAVGLEFSGTVVATGADVRRWQVGDSVVGCNFTEGALPSHLCVGEDAVFGMNEELTFCEAATIPTAFATAYYCLVMEAGLKMGETVLIHAASGGVGLFAIQVARAVGANVIATAGSRRKRTFLRNLGIQHVFHSRNTDYAKHIHGVTRGKGVQVVLNSLTSPGFKEASLEVCSANARFVEMSKLQIWTPEEVRKLREDVSYTVVDLTTVTKSTWESIWEAVARYTKDGHLSPIPYIQYDATCIREALTYMQKAKHIGKIIITMPDMVVEKESGELIARNDLFSSRATYLITGGLGGIGMELAKWMCTKGAKHLVLTSRRSPDERAVKIMKDLNSKGNNVIPICLDVGDYPQCIKLLKDINDPKLNLPRLRGIMHSAGALADATFPNQTFDLYKSCFQGKVYGALNLHNLTTNLHLDFFVMFSSMASIFGPIGQSNYSAANMFLDSLAHYRHSLGLAGQSVNWGQWGEVGLSKDIKIPALRPFSPSAAFSALEVIMRSQKSQVCVLDVDFSVVRKLTANIGSYLEELKVAKETQSVAFQTKIANFWEDFNAAGGEGPGSKLDVIKSYICNILREILRLDEGESIDEAQKFSEMGMDSLMMLEMKNFIQTMLGKSITMNVSELAELTTVNKLSAHLMMLIQAAAAGTGDNEETHSYNYFTPAEKALIDEDMVLPDSVRLNGTPCRRSEIRSVLLTGSTGKLGPYMLEAISRRSLDKIFCLIRSKDDISARDRLIKVLSEKSLTEAVDMTRVVCMAGDITKDKLGLAQEKYDVLATLVDAVVHCAVKGNLMEPYKKWDAADGDGGSDIRSVNVIGTRHILEFAAAAGLGSSSKPVLHASTLLACHKVAPDDTLLEEWCDAQDVYEMPNVGYPVSKFICETLAAQAVQRGIPIHVHRFPGLLGDKNGCFSFPNNHAMLRLLGFCKLRVMPANPIPLQLLDVDYAAEISCLLFFNDFAPPDVYNITNPHLCVLQDFPVLAAEFGFQIDVVDYREFFERLYKDDEFASLFPYREVDFEGDRFVDYTASPVALQCWINNPDEFFVSRKLQAFFKDYKERTQHPIQILRRDMQFAKDTNVFGKFGLC